MSTREDHVPGNRRNPRGRRAPVRSATSRSALREKHPTSPDDYPNLSFRDFDWIKSSAGATLGEILARGLATVTGSQDTYEGVKTLIDYGFQKVDQDGLADIARWASNPNASYEEMPPGALRYELPAGMVPGIGDIQALRDVFRDVSNKEVSGWTAVDAISMIPMLGVLGDAVRSGKKLNSQEMGRLWRAVDDMRRNHPTVDDDAILEMVVGPGIDEASARRVMNMEVDPLGPIRKAPETGYTSPAVRLRDGGGIDGKGTIVEGDYHHEARWHAHDEGLDATGEDGWTHGDTFYTREEVNAATGGRAESGVMRREGRAGERRPPRVLEYTPQQRARYEGVTSWDKQVAKELNEQIRKGGDEIGISRSIEGLDPDVSKGERYMVAPRKESELKLPLKEITAQQVADFRVANAEEIGNGAFFGAWADEGSLYLDASRALPDEAAALEVGRVGGQEAIFDMETFKSIEVPKAQPPVTTKPARVTNKTPINETETIHSTAAKIAGLSLLNDTSIDDAMDWALEAIGPEVGDFADDLLPRVGRIRERWADKLGSDVDDRLMRRFELGSGDFVEDWYDSILPAATDLFGEDMGRIWARAYAFTSAGADAGKDNIRFANKALNQIAAGDPIDTGRYPTMAGRFIERALADMESPMPVRHTESQSGLMAPKLREFDENISFAGDKAIIDMWSSRLMQNALDKNAGSGFDAVSPEGYQVMQSLMHGAADRTGIPRRGFQAGTWGGEKIAWGEDPAGLLTGGDLLRRHPDVQNMVRDGRTGLLLPFVGGERYGLLSVP